MVMLTSWLLPGRAQITCQTITLYYRLAVGGSTATTLVVPRSKCLCQQQQQRQQQRRRNYASSPHPRQGKRTNYYTTLKVHRTATQDEIKEAYYDLSKVYHPDANHDEQNEEKFNEITEAYNVLKNATLRSRYDSDCKNPSSGGGFTVSKQPFTGSDVEYSYRHAEDESFKKWAEKMNRRQKDDVAVRRIKRKMFVRRDRVSSEDLHLDGRHLWGGAGVTVVVSVVVVFVIWKYLIGKKEVGRK